MAIIPKSRFRADPILIFNIVIAGMAAIIGPFGGYLCWRNYYLLETLQTRYLPLEQCADDLRQLDGAMRMAARDAAATGEIEWERNHREALKAFRAKLGRAIALAPREDLQNSIFADIARREQLEIEEKVFDLVRNGQIVEARNLVFGRGYFVLRQNYDKKLSRMASQFEGFLHDDVLQLQNLTRRGMEIVFWMLGFLAIVCLIANSTLRNYIARRNEVEQALRESQARYRDLIENVPVGIYRLPPGPAGGFLAANRAMARMFGYDSAEELMRCEVRDLYADQDKRRAFSKRLREEGRIIGAELPLRKRDGSLMWGAVSANLVRDDQGQLACVDGTVEDITEWKRAEEALRNNERSYRLIAENSSDVIWTMDLSLRLTYVSPSIDRLRGFTPEEAMKQQFTDLIAPEWRDEAARMIARELSPRALRSADPFRTVTLELEVLHKDGTRVPVELRVSFLHDAAGKIIGIQGSTRDIRERRRAEAALRESDERYRVLSENVRDVIWTTRMDKSWSYVSPAVFHLTGFTPEEVMARGMMDLLTPESGELARQVMREGFEAEKKRGKVPAQVTSLELEVLRKDGGTIWTEATVAFLRDSMGVPVGLQGSIRDITERRRAREALQQSEALYRGIIETADEGIWTVDAENRTTFVNGKIIEMLGFKADEMSGRSQYEFLDESSFPTALENESLLRQGQRTHADLQFRRKNGDALWGIASASPLFDPSGEYAGTLFMISDITDRKLADEAVRRSEERYRLLAENARDVILTTDMELNVTYISPAIEAMTGFSPEEMMTPPLNRILTPQSYRVAREVFDAELAEEMLDGSDPNRIRTFEIELSRKEGGTVWTETKVSFLRDESGRAIGIQGSMRDNSERRGVEEALRKSEELHRGIIETADEGVWIVDSENETSFVNHKMARMLGYTTKEMAGRRKDEFMSPEDLESAHRAERLLRQGIRTHMDIRLKRKDGGDLWAISSTSPMFDDQGTYTGALSMMTDITERKRAEDGSKVLTAVSSLFLAGKDINRAVCTVLEMCGEFDGADRASVFLLEENRKRMSNTHEWRREGITSFLREMQNVETAEFRWFLDQLERGQSVIVPTIETLPPSLRAHLSRQETQSLIAFPIFILGKFEGYCGFDSVMASRDWTGSDVSVLRQATELIARGIERKRAEEALRNSEQLYTSLVEQLAQGVFRKDREGRLIFANSNYCALLRKPLDEILGRTAFDLYPAETAAKVAARDQGVMDGGKPFETVEQLHLRPEETKRWFHIVKTPLKDARGETVGLQGLIWDVTELKRSEEALIMASRLEATATLAGGIAHDFNNLMVGILGNAELLQLQVPEDAAFLKRIKTIATSARRGGDLANQLLSFARGGKTKPIPMNLKEIIEEALQIQHRAIPPGVEVVLQVEPDLWDIQADPVQMTQVVMNLCVNAVESLTGEGRITISAENVELSGSQARERPGLVRGPYVCLSVRDTGVGMSQEVRERVFEPFFTTKFQGRGLGLASIHGIVRNHGGVILVESEPGKGSAFKVYLPARAASAVAASV